MKSRTQNSIETMACCNMEDTKEKQASCCEQPVDNTACCDKEVSKKENSVKTGCC